MSSQITCVATTLLALLLNVHARSYQERNDISASFEDDQLENSLTPIGASSSKSSSDIMKDFIKITSSTEGVLRVRQGDTIELECVAVGSYTPSVDWFKGHVRVTEPEDNNHLTKFGVTRMVVKYIVDCAQRKHEGTYTCSAMSGDVSTISPPVNVIVSDKISPRLLIRTGECRRNQKLPRIIRYSPFVMHTMGTDVKLLCRAQGESRPYVYWTDKNGHMLDTSAGSRYQLLDSGDLIIRNLRWPDMGVYLCMAENNLGKDTTSTFLYPMLAEKSDQE